MTALPEIRASHVRKNLESASYLGADAVARLRAAVSEETLRAVEEAPRVAWVPVSLDIEINRASVHVFGAEANRTRVRRGLLATIDGPLLRPILDGAIHLFGLSPASFLRLAPTAWRAMYHNFGQPRHVVEGERHGALVLDDAPSILLEAHDYLTGIGHALEAILEISRRRGTVVATVAGPSTARWDVRWDEE